MKWIVFRDDSSPSALDAFEKWVADGGRAREIVVHGSGVQPSVIFAGIDEGDEGDNLVCICRSANHAIGGAPM